MLRSPGWLWRSCLAEHVFDRLTEFTARDWSDDVVASAGWGDVLQRFGRSAHGVRLVADLTKRLSAGAVVFPPHPLRALTLTPLSSVKVVILGQDPYHAAGQAEGLAFSVPPGVRIPPSLRNIFKELLREGLIDALPSHGSLVAWARQGVLLLNTALTVEESAPASHARVGWEALTDDMLQEVASTRARCVYLLWGAHAQSKEQLIRQSSAASKASGRNGLPDILILKANHPSPLSALRPPTPFIGCGHFGIAQRWWSQRGVDLAWRAV